MNRKLSHKNYIRWTLAGRRGSSQTSLVWAVVVDRASLQILLVLIPLLKGGASEEAALDLDGVQAGQGLPPWST
jgi:hypothetical protein